MARQKKLKSVDFDQYFGFDESKSNVPFVFSDDEDGLNNLLTDQKPVRKCRAGKINIEVEEPFAVRAKSKSMDAKAFQRRPSMDTTTLTGAIVMILKGTNELAIEQIVEKIKPAFNFLKKHKKDSVINDIYKSVEGCLNASKNKVFHKNEKLGLWTLEPLQGESNYFQHIDKTLTHKPKDPLKFNIKKRNYEEYNDTVEKLTTCIKYFAKKPKVFAMIKKNPFKKLKKVPEGNQPLVNAPGELILANMISAEDSSNKGERLIGVLQCFYYFYPMLKELPHASHIRLKSLLNKMQSSVNHIQHMMTKS